MPVAWRQAVLQWIGGRDHRRGIRTRSQKSTRLGVESLEMRALLSTTTPAGDEPMDFPGFRHEAPGAYASPYDQGPLAGAWSDDAQGSVYEEPPSVDGKSPSRHAAWAPPEAASLRATHFEPPVVFVVRLVRVTTPSPLRLSTPTADLGTSFNGGQSDLPGVSANGSKGPLGLKAQGGTGNAPAGDSPLDVAASMAAERSTAWLPVVSSPSPTAGGGQYLLLRALESRDAVFRALAASPAKRGGEISQALTRGDEDEGSVDVEVRGGEAKEDGTYDEDLAFDDAFESTSLGDAAEQQADAMAAAVELLAGSRPEGCSQPRPNDGAELQPPTEPAPSAAAGEAISDEQGGMILLRGAAAAMLASTDDAYGALGAAPPAPVGMQAEIGLYQAFGVVAGEPLDDVPAAAALPTKTASPTGGENQNGRESASAPTASTASPEAVVTASVVSLTVAASGLRPRSYPQMRRERR